MTLFSGKDPIAVLLWAAVAALLLVILALCLRYEVAAVAYPFAIDISEGAVWQQLTRIPGRLMYGDIGVYPFLNFEYPPFYHLVVRALAATRLDTLAAGRTLSLVSAATVCLLIGRIVATLHPTHARRARLTIGSLAAVLPCCLLPFIIWSSLMRVDLFGLALTYAGIVLGLHAFQRRRALYPAMLFFVLACYTKQTFVSAPLAMLAVHALRDRRLAMRAILLGLALGLPILATLEVVTKGGFLLHVLIYNVNRFNLADAVDKTTSWLGAYPIFAAITVAAAAFTARDLVTARRIRTDAPTAARAFLLLYLLLTTATLIASGKAGASLNYFLEWMALWCIWIGIAAGLAVQRYGLHGPLSLCLPALLLLQLAFIPAGFHLLYASHLSPGYAVQERALLARLYQLDGLILSDDQVILRRAAKPLSPEMPMLAELAHNGRWDGGKLLHLIDTNAFAAILTQYGPGVADFDDRYLPAVQAALARHYPVVQRFNDFRLCLPAPR